MAVPTRSYNSTIKQYVETVVGVGTTVEVKPFSHKMSDYWIDGMQATYLADDGWKTVAWETNYSRPTPKAAR